MKNIFKRSILALMETRGIMLEGETPFHVFNRVANAIDEMEVQFGHPRRGLGDDLMRGIDERKVILGTPILTNCGRESRPTGACAVIPVDIRSDMSVIQSTCEPYFKSGMGTGFNFDDVEDATEKLLEMNEVFKIMEKDCDRPVACMATISTNHPEIIDFLSCKKNEDFSDWRFNISVTVEDDFMNNIIEGRNDFQDEQNDIDIFEALVDSTYYCGEPGILFKTRIDEDNPTPFIAYESVAPCAEIAMSPGEQCQFGYINLSQFLSGGNQLKFDYEELIEYTRLLTRVLDNTVEMTVQNTYEEIISSKRRIGIGICGLADLFIRMDIVYGEEESIRLIDEIMSIIQYFSKYESLQLSKERGRFPLFNRSLYQSDPNWILRKINNDENSDNFISSEMWNQLAEEVAIFGIRNSGTVALPPTGTSSRLFEASTSLEPIFSVISNHDNHDNLNDKEDEEKRFMKSIHSGICDDLSVYLEHLSKEERRKAINEITKTGSVQQLKSLSEEKRKIWEIGTEISVERHMDILVAIQKHNDESTSKTFNVKNDISKESIQDIFVNAYRNKLKGIAIFRDGCLEERKM